MAARNQFMNGDVRRNSIWVRLPGVALLCATVLLGGGRLCAAPVEVTQARQMASAYTLRSRELSGRGLQAVPKSGSAVSVVDKGREVVGRNGKTIGFVFSFDPIGFVLVRADDDLPPVKLYSDDSSYAALPDGFRKIMEAELEGECAGIAKLRAAGDSPDTDFHSVWRAVLSKTRDSKTSRPALLQKAASGDKVLLTTKWNQGNPYNEYAPVVKGGSGGRAWMGCGPCAVAQILRYHKAPLAPLADHAYSDAGGECMGTHRLSDVGSLEPYDWGNMPDSISASSPLAQRKAVGRLMYHCSVAAEASFGGESGTPTFSNLLEDSLRYVFGYDCDSYGYRSDYTPSAWYAMIKADIDNSRPILYAVTDVDVGSHAVVCDGYRNENEIHLNFGWSGQCSAWYNMDTVVCDGDDWSSDHDALFNITPARGLSACTVVFQADGGTVSPASKKVVCDACYGDLPVPSKEGCLFLGWWLNVQGRLTYVDRDTRVKSPSDHVLAARWLKAEDGAYLSIDLSGGLSATRYPVRYFNGFATVPGGITNDAYKTDKCLLRKISAGSFAMGPAGASHTVTLTKDYYIGVFEVTHRQWELVMGTRPSACTNASNDASLPVERVTYNDIRGAAEPGWPSQGSVNDASFMGRLRSKTGLDTLDLPTEAQWEYACRAGTAGRVNTGLDSLTDEYVPWVGRFLEEGEYYGMDTEEYLYTSGNAGYADGVLPRGTVKVGSYYPNAWRLFDMQGNVKEWCLDWFGDYPDGTVTDPVGAESGSYRVLRGMGWRDSAYECDSAARNSGLPEQSSEDGGLRLAVNVISDIQRYELTVSGGSGGGTYAAGTKVAVAVDSVSSGKSFVRWEVSPADADLGSDFSSVLAATTVVVPERDVTLVAVFSACSSIRMGVALELPLPDAFTGEVSVAVKGLPAGLKYNPTTRKIEGVPAQAGTFPVRISAAGVTQSITLTVESLPAWAQGTFNGYVENAGRVTMTVSAAGKITGKVALPGMNYTFAVSSFAAGGDEKSGFEIETAAKAGNALLPLKLRITQAGSPQAASFVSGQLGNLPVSLYRSVWKDPGAAALADNYDGYYTAALPGNGRYGSGYLAFTVDMSGGVKIAGKLADGTAVSQAGALILDMTGGVFTVVFTAPTTYKGGSLFGFADFVAPAEGAVYLCPPDGVPFLWASRNLQATFEYGKGFSRTLGLAGGWYSKTENLYDYYRNRRASVGTDTNAPVPEIFSGSIPEPSDWWSPDGIALTVMTNKTGVMTGLTAPMTGTPVKNADGTYEYAAAPNTLGLKISLSRATGFFKGSYKAWFDYAGKHTSKGVSFEGALTPVREDLHDGVAGRGFFLWADKSLSPAYSFNWSYDFRVLVTDDVP